MASSRPFALPLGPTRLADITDAPHIVELISDSMAHTFRVSESSEIVYLIENSVLSVCQLNLENTIVGFLSLREYPSIPCVHPGAWEEYIWTKYKDIELKARNTLFVHLLCWQQAYTRELIDNMLQTIMHNVTRMPKHTTAIELKARNTLFVHLLCWHQSYTRELVDDMLKTVLMHDQYLNYICMIKTDLRYPMLRMGQGRAESSFRRVQALERGLPGDRLPALYVCDRKDVSPRLRIRRAVEEDNDDIVPIIERHSKRLRELYGDFYISELIARHPESERVLLVCEHKELAVGIMCLNTQINFEALEESYDLSPYAGLRVVEEGEERIKTPTKDLETFFSESAIKHGGESLSSIKSSTHLDLEKICQIKMPLEEDDELDNTESGTREATGTYARVSTLDLFFGEDDEIEFDIVNIDAELLRLPDLITPSDQIFKNILDGKQKEPSQLFDQGKKERKRQLSTGGGVTSRPEPTVRYSGKSNAFLLELFSVHPDYDERYGFDMLEVAFELFPNRDYCVMSLPSSQSTFPLLEHFVLCTPYSSTLKFISESLYVAHINSVRGDVRVREGEAADLKHLKDVLENAPRKDALMDLYDVTLTTGTLNSYILLAQNQPIGLIVTGPLENGTTIRTQYDLKPEPNRPGTDGTIIAGVMSTALKVHSRWYMREVMRMSPHSTLFWISQPMGKGDASPSRNMMSLADRMIPIRPRRSIPNISGYKELDRIFKEAATPFALWILERPLSVLPKLYVNNKIVVVGASRTGLAFLESLIMGPASKYLTFTNLMLISEHGLPVVTESLKAAITCIPRDGRYTDHYMKSVPFCFYVDVMPAVMVHIDRKKKCIHLKGGGMKFYDELVLTCGHQFQHPEYLRESLELVKELEKGKTCERMLMDNPKYQPDRVPPPPDLPENVMLINTLHQANTNLKKILRMVADEPNSLKENRPIVVYGDCIEAYCCMAALIEVGIQPKDILFVETFPPEDPLQMRINCFNDEKIDERVQLTMKSLGIRVLRQSRLIGWQLSNGRVTSLRLMSYLNYIRQPCFAMFYYGLKAIDLYAFKAINECGLVYDGGLIVGPTFETNDPAIYGAGTCVRYSRRLYASRNLHRYYCSEDVGNSLAQLFLEKLDPYVMCNMGVQSEIEALLNFGTSASMMTTSVQKVAEGPRGANNPNLSRRWQPVMKFDSPILISATLPGPLYYMKLRKPGPDIPMEVQLSLPHQGHTLETDHKDNYFRLRLNVLHVVEAVTCLSHTPFSADLFLQLYGKHEAFFNQLLLRYQMEQIDDLFTFFTMPWLSALYHESFDELLNNIDLQEVSTMHNLLKSRHGSEGEKFREFLANLVSSARPDSPTIIGDEEDKERPRTHTFRSLMTQFVSSHELMQFAKKNTDIPTECGQCAAIRKDVAKFWESIEGERIIHAHITDHISRNVISNPHYAAPDPSLV